MQIDTAKLEKQIAEPNGTDREKTARTIFWLRVANLLETAHELLLGEVRDRKSREGKP
jgi:hypothetical protein